MTSFAWNHTVADGHKIHCQVVNSISYQQEIFLEQFSSFVFNEYMRKQEKRGRQYVYNENDEIPLIIWVVFFFHTQIIRTICLNSIFDPRSNISRLHLCKYTLPRILVIKRKIEITEEEQMDDRRAKS